jgi:4-hydroxybenzoate polyprenyltransferase
LRIIAGALATGVELSVWLLAFSMFFFFALAAIKRQGELVDLKSRGVNKPQRRGYSVDDLPLVQQMSITSGYLSVLVLALYLNAPAVQQLYSAPWLLWGICLVLLYWISRLALKTHRGLMLDDPIVYALRDTKSLICVGLMAGFAVAAAVL